MAATRLDHQRSHIICTINKPASTTTYHVTAINNINVLRTDSIRVRVSAISINILNIKDVFCNGKCNGSATVIAIGRHSSIHILTGLIVRHDSTATKLCAGKYFVTVKDKNGCAAKTYINITDTSSFKVTVDSTNLKCFGICNGSAIANVSGGQQPYTYEWDNGQTASSINNLCAGIHSITVTESLGCMRNISFQLFSH